MKISSAAFLLAFLALASAQPETLPLCSSPEADEKNSDFGQEGLCLDPQVRHQRRRAETTSPIEPPAEDDFTFVVNAGTDLDTPCTFRDQKSPLVFTVEITRFFGDVPKLLDAGLISDTATLTIPAYDVDFDQGEFDEVSINGNVLTPYLTGENKLWKLNTFYVPITMLNFPSDPGAGGTVVPAGNEIKVDIDVGLTFNWCAAVDWAAIKLQQAPRPVVLFHGLLSDGDVWNSQWVTKLAELGIPHDAGADLGHYSSIQSNAALIEARVAAARARFGVSEVDIVAHSKGGLDARHYAETATDVVDLIQIAAPNGGTPLADFGQLVSIAALSISNTVVIYYFASGAAVQLTTDYMTTYNSIHGLNADVSYAVMAGEYDADCAPTDLSCRTLDRLLLAVSGSPGDTIVPKWSAHNLLGTSKLVFSSVGSDESAKHRPLIESAQVFDQIQGSVAIGLDTSLSATDPDCQITRLLAGSVAQGETFSASLDLDGATEAYIVLSFPSGALGFTLSSPDGTVINPTYASANPTVAGYQSSVFYDGYIAVYNLVNPRVGSWTVQVAGDVVDEARTVFVVNAFLFQPHIKLEAWLATRSVVVGTPLVYLARPTDSGTPILGATAKATVALPDGTLTTVTLHDDGVSPDTVSGDGVYMGSLMTSQSGNYRAAVSVESAGSPSFSREDFVLGTAATSTVSLSVSGDNPRDTDGDTLYNFLDVNIDITSQVSGDFLLLCTLTDSQGNEQTVTHPVYIATSATQVTVTFDGRTIFNNGVDGPYKLSSVRVTVESEFGLAVVADMVNVYSTIAYGYMQFQRDPLRLVGGTTNPIDTNGNSLYDLLNINLLVESDIVGAYNWSCTLRDVNNTEIDFDYGSVTLVRGSNTLYLSFDGLKIGNNFVDGPYYVSDFILFGRSSSDESLSIVSKAYTTYLLYWTQFECTLHPTKPPSLKPTTKPTAGPTDRPTSPTVKPSAKPTTNPTTASPTRKPSPKPTNQPTAGPTDRPTSPTVKPSPKPTKNPTTATPTRRPSPKPTNQPTAGPTDRPTSPTVKPSPKPTKNPTTESPSSKPTMKPTGSPTDRPTLNPTATVTLSPTPEPTARVTSSPTAEPIVAPTKNPSTSSPTRSPILRTICPEVTDFCKDPETTFGLPLLDLTLGSTLRPIVDGAFDEVGYSSFLELPMFESGKNGDSGSPLDNAGRIGTAYLAYDHVNGIVCAAARLDQPSTSSLEVLEQHDRSWIQFGNGTKLFQNNADEFEYGSIQKPDQTDFTIGYEGCWNVDAYYSGMGDIVNNHVQVRFSGFRIRDEIMFESIISTGQQDTFGRLICVIPKCPETPLPSMQPAAPEPTPSPIPLPTHEPTPWPTHTPDPTTRPTSGITPQPSTQPTPDPTSEPTAEPTPNPTSQPTPEPTSDPTLDPTLQPTADPTPDPTPDPTLQPTTQPIPSPTLKPSPKPTSWPSNPPTLSLSPTCDYSTIDAINNEVTTPVNTPIDIKVLDNDVAAADQSILDIKSILFSGNHGSCTLGSDRETITYTPNMDYYGTDTCIYTACDAKGRCDSAAIIINVTPVIANDDVATTEITTPVSIYPLDNDISFAGTVLSVVSITESAMYGQCLVMNSQVVVYIPKPNFHGVDRCVYTACVADGLCDSAVITITVDGEPCDDKPTRNIDMTMRPSLRPTTRQPTLKPISPTAAPMACESRLFRYVNGCCTNEDITGSSKQYASFQDCCNEWFHNQCCNFKDVCFVTEIDPLEPSPPSPKWTMHPTNKFSGVCYDEWEPKYYAPGDKVTSFDGKNYQCDADYYLYCAQDAFKPGSGMASELAWNRLPSTCTETRHLKSSGCTV